MLYKHYTYSIFYNQNDWHKLLRFIKSNFASKDESNSFFIKLSLQQGAHIEFTISQPENSSIHCLDKIATLLTNFVAANPSQKEGIRFEKHLLFLNFPNNTVHFGIVDFQLESKFTSLNFNLTTKIYHGLTLLILDIFDQFGSDTLNMLQEILFEMHLIFCYESNYDLNENTDFFGNLIQEELLQYDVNVIDKMKRIAMENFVSNKELIINSIDESLLNQNNNLKSKMLKEWTKLICLSTTLCFNKKVKYQYNQQLFSSLSLLVEFNTFTESYLLFGEGLNYLCSTNKTI